MTDMVERLRATAPNFPGAPDICMREAADEIERLRRYLEAERTVNRIVENHNHFDCAEAMARKDIANGKLQAEIETLRADKENLMDELGVVLEREHDAALAEIETLRALVKGLLTVIDKQEPYVTHHLLRTGERLDEAEVAPLRAFVEQARELS